MDSQDETDWATIYQTSLYAFERDGVWREFALDGEGPPYGDLADSVTLITAWNPGSRERPRDRNDAANLALQGALEEAQRAFSISWGSSLPGVTPAWREEGFAVFGLTRLEAACLGSEWGQAAVVWLNRESSELIFCEEGYSVACGLRALPKSSL